VSSFEFAAYRKLATDWMTEPPRRKRSATQSVSGSSY